ncbi:epithelial cell adhesion molecule [Ascaphus truei]|uniref:epithelial cell adhesion molecule n=1 Tax=Ascaphus truei TaxID=8439 RepID=UPI003F5A03A1
MKISMVLRLGTTLLCCVLAVSQAQGCKCTTHFQGKCTGDDVARCQCILPLGDVDKSVDCNKLVPKCLLMKKESIPSKGGRRLKPEHALVDNDGLYNPDCEDNGAFKARQCNGTDTCWCVNTAGVRRTDKGDKNWKCSELVRTFWLMIQMKRNNTDQVDETALKAAIKTTFTSRYKLTEKHVTLIEFEGPFIYIDLKQNASEKAPGDVDIADVGYYLEKDIKGDSIFHPDEKFKISVDGKDFGVQEPLIYYIDEKAPEISMKRLTAGVIAVIVVVVLAIVAGIVVLVLTRRKKGKYEKAEVKEMNEMQKELTS